MLLKFNIANVFLLIFLLFQNCANDYFKPLHYDPPGSTNTSDKTIQFQHKRTIGFQNASLWVSNEFDGARLNDFFQVNDSTYTAIINPENEPINNSAWYAFKIWSFKKQSVSIRLTYNNGDHRYHPKISKDRISWQRLDSLFYHPDTVNKSAELQLTVGPDTLWVAAQELLVSKDFDRKIDNFAQYPFASKTLLGHSKMGKPIYKLDITEADPVQGYVLIISRQHPPEVTGTLALFSFLETVCNDSELSRAFRKRFCVSAIPLMNPDGADNGHWRHNTGGVDLNRDWFSFNQPETRLARDVFLETANHEGKQVYLFLDFHSTQRDIFYTLDKNLKTIPDGFTDKWLNKIRQAFPHYHLRERPSGTGSPVSKNWFYETFKAPSITYEVGDETDRQLIRQVASGAAIAMMELLLEEIK